MNRVSTRNDMLDKSLNGGLPVGTITTLVSSPASQYSPLFYGFLQDRPWLYVTTYQSRAAVEDELDDLLWGDIRVEHVGVEEPVEELSALMESLDDERNVMIHTTNPMETTEEPAEYTRLLNAVKEYIIENDTIALLHGTEYDRSPPRQRETTLTMADVVIELETIVEGQEIKNQLKVPKSRQMQSIDEVIKLDISQDVSVDTSRNIA